MILAGDLGGTNARFALFATAGAATGTPRFLWRETFPSRNGDWTEYLARALRAAGDERVSAAALAVAGPVEQGVAQLTNLRWKIGKAELARRTGLPRARVLNDLEAAARGLAVLGPSDLSALQTAPGSLDGNRVLCSPGTGLGVAALVRDGQRDLALASEGGHATFAPLDDEDRALAQYLAEQHGHVSWERVLSGPGLIALHEFQRDARGLAEPPELGRALAGGEGPAAITRHALTGRAPSAERALERFAHILGIAASNLALEFLARGVYLGGGIPPRILPFLERPPFREAYLTKGRMRAWLERTSVHVVLNPDCALLGAARCAAESLAEAEA